MMMTLFGRLYYVQCSTRTSRCRPRDNLHSGTIVIPAPRGQIVDATGRPLVDNTSDQVITVDRQTLHGAARPRAAPC